MTKPAHNTAHSDEISLVDLWSILREDWLIPAITTVIGIALAVFAVYTLTPYYRAQVVVAPVSSGGGGNSAASSILGQFGGLANLAGVNLRGLAGASMDGRTLIESRTFVEQFVKEQNLLPLLYADRWDADANNWNADVMRPPQTWQGANKFMSDVLFIREDNETGLLTLAVEWTDAHTAAKWANRLVALANETARKNDMESAQARVAYLNEQIATTTVVDLKGVLYNLLEAEMKTLMLANASSDYVFQVVDPAVVPVSIAKPKPLFLLVLGTIAGGFFGLVIVFVRRIVRGLNQQKAARDAARTAA
jgi:uncharacterized protein involved in exopolysaccharide biosynthesis